jgi:hypothetical protein
MNHPLRPIADTMPVFGHEPINRSRYFYNFMKFNTSRRIIAILLPGARVYIDLQSGGDCPPQRAAVPEAKTGCVALLLQSCLRGQAGGLM